MNDHLVRDAFLHETLGIRTVELSPDGVILEMDVGPRVHQPMGLLHGGASAVLAEGAASMGAYASCDVSREVPVGVELNISHLRGMRSGTLTATARPIRKGRSLQVWAVELEDQDGRPVAVARCTLALRAVDSSNAQTT